MLDAQCSVPNATLGEKTLWEWALGIEH
jgi:hypothetical protein